MHNDLKELLISFKLYVYIYIYIRKNKVFKNNDQMYV